ncbi:MAG: alpha/beta hydrolase [Streptosporangiales bacterium]|nr:alpha/beta hydrolase [Streptosporangiales bacterium]
MSTEVEIETSVGVAGVALDVPDGATALIVLGHGAGGGVEARDLLAVRSAATTAGLAVARTTQPYRMAGRKSPAPAKQLDAAFGEIVAALLTRAGLRDLPVVTGGRSSGARVACRTAAATGARGVVALAFPLHPPGRPDRSRADELHDTPVPVFVAQGERDPFGSPEEIRATEPPATVRIHPVPGGDHGLAVRKGEPSAYRPVADEVVRWVFSLVAG